MGLPSEKHELSIHGIPVADEDDDIGRGLLPIGEFNVDVHVGIARASAKEMLGRDVPDAADCIAAERDTPHVA